MKEVINIQETTREKKRYVRPQITMIPMLAEHALLAGSDKKPGGGSLEGGDHSEIPDNPDEG